MPIGPFYDRHRARRLRDVELMKLAAPPPEALGLAPAELVAVHRFLDALNGYLDRDFSLLRDAFFPGSWKLGFAYGEYSDRALSYALYPIPFDGNDIQIKRVPAEHFRKLLEEGVTSIRWSTGNPIQRGPLEYAREIVGELLEELFDNRLLRYDSRPVATEIVLAGIEHLGPVMGLRQQRRYRLDRVREGLLGFMPRWVERAAQRGLTRHGERSAIDIDATLKALTPEDRRALQRAASRKTKGKRATGAVPPFWSRTFRLQRLLDAVVFLQAEGGRTLSAEKPSGFEEVASTFWKALPQGYSEVARSSFPRLPESETQLSSATRLLVLLEGKRTPTRMRVVQLEGSRRARMRVELVARADAPAELEKPRVKPGTEVKLGRQRFRVLSEQHYPLSILSRALPLTDYVTDQLAQRVGRLLLADPAG